MENIKLDSFEVVGKRPEGMDYATYKEQQHKNRNALRKRLKGTLVYTTKEVITDPQTGQPTLGRTVKEPYSREKHGAFKITINK